MDLHAKKPFLRLRYGGDDEFNYYGGGLSMSRQPQRDVTIFAGFVGHYSSGSPSSPGPLSLLP